MPCTRQLLRRCQARRARTNHRHFFTCFLSSGLRHNPTILPSFFCNKSLDGLNTHRVAIYIQSASRFARRRTNAPRKLRKIIGGMQCIQRLLIIAFVNQIIPIRNDVVNRTACCTKRRTAIHATRSLHCCLFICHWNDKFFVVFEALCHCAIFVFLTIKLHEACNFTHTKNLYIQIRF